MPTLQIPLEISKGELVREANLKDSIDKSLRALITTPLFSSIADPAYGFVFNNLSFEIFDEKEGVIYNSTPDTSGFAELAGLYDKKISGSSRNMNTFASELQQTISKYETRLKDVTVSMTNIREERNIYVVIKGVIAETNEPYQYTNIIKIWN